MAALERLLRRRPELSGAVQVHLAGGMDAADRAAIRSDAVVLHGYVAHAAAVTLMRSADLLFLPMHDVPPPSLADDAELSQVGDPRYAALPTEIVPRTECLKDVVIRLLPYWYDAIVPDLRTGGIVMVAAHGNSLRALVKHLDGISDEDIAGLNIPTGMPLIYRLDDGLQPTVRGGEYLDPEAAAKAAAAVANQGR